MLEALGDIGDGSSSNLAVIQPFTEHPRPLIRSAACRALLQLTGLDQWGMELKKLLNHPEPLVRRGALLDLGATGWLAAPCPRSKTAAVEPSLKLVALREVAERNVDPVMTFSTQWMDCSDDQHSIGPGASDARAGHQHSELVKLVQALCALNDLAKAAKTL